MLDPLSQPKMLEVITDSLPMGLVVVDFHGGVVFANRKAEELFGYQEGELIGAPMSQLVPERYRHAHGRNHTSYTRDPSPRPMGQGRVLPGLCKDGSEVMLEIGILPIPWGEREYVLATLIEIDNPVIRVASTNDPLTGLPNRYLLRELCESRRESAARNGQPLAMMFIDLDGFKAINDQHGHRAGDEMLVTATQAIRAHLREADLVGRIGGDEFVVMLAEVDIDELARLGAAVSEGVSGLSLPGVNVSLSASIGAVWSARAEDIDIEAMIEQADSLMYQAKKQGGGRVVCAAYTPPQETHP